MRLEQRMLDTWLGLAGYPFALLVLRFDALLHSGCACRGHFAPIYLRVEFLPLCAPLIAGGLVLLDLLK